MDLNRESQSRNSLNDLFFAKCRCCLEHGDLKNLWGVLNDVGELENYGEMIVECFALPWQEPMEHTEHICDACVEIVRDAHCFKKKVLAVEQIILQQLEYEVRTISKPTTEGTEVNKQSKYKDINEMQIHEVVKEELSSLQDFEMDEEDSADYQQEEEEYSQGASGEEYKEEKEFSVCNSEEAAEYLEVEYLEEPPSDLFRKAEDNAVAKGEPSNTPKWPRKKKKHEKMMTYKQYSEDDLWNAIDAVKSHKMTKAQAAAHYNIPIKTLACKVRAEEMKEVQTDAAEPEVRRHLNHEKQYKFIKEIKTILTYTNATPYKTKAGRYYCAYCGTEGEIFETADELRTHTRTQHADQRLKNIEICLRPNWLNEVLKLDIENLTCTVCCVSIEGWNEMFKHLLEHHEIELDEAYTRVIPYKLNEDLSCALCNEKYKIYCKLDAHMNAHYSNYICNECGDTFLSMSRMKKHVETHSVGKFPCTQCDKVFSLEKYRRKHIEGVHSTEAKIRCLHCGEKFKGEYMRHLHVLEHHKEKVKIITCEHCGKTFDWRPYYMKHVRLRHTTREKKFECSYCDKKFVLKHELKNHEDWHRGDSGHVCKICGKKFTSKPYLQKHLKKHSADDNAATVLIVES